MGKLFTDLKAERAIAETGRKTAFGFLLLDGFSQLAFAAAVETLARANATVGWGCYSWTIVTPDGFPAESLAGTMLAPCGQVDRLPRHTALVVLGGSSLSDERRRRVIACLRREVAHGRQILGIADAVILMAEAGVFAGIPCAVHWRYATCFAERFPEVEVQVSAFVRARHSTISGCMATADFFLEQIRSDLGEAVARTVADHITHRSVRGGDAPQTGSDASRIGARNPAILRVVRVMEENLASPPSVEVLATVAGMSVRHLERQFQIIFNATPLKFFLRLRLDCARDLVFETDLPLDDIAEITGFSSAHSLSRKYKKVFGTSPFLEHSNRGTEYGPRTRKPSERPFFQPHSRKHTHETASRSRAVADAT
jgi:transcriptional regulator GlxA family with amidase domain